MSTFKYSAPLPEPARQAKLSLVAPAVLVRYVEALRSLRKDGYHIVPFETQRTSARQHWLWQQGREWAGAIVTNAQDILEGWHGAGFALDSAFVTSAGDVTWDVPETTWEVYGQRMEDHGLAWGGRWGRPDSPHVQARNLPTKPTVRDQDTLSAGNFTILTQRYNLNVVSYFDDPSKI